MLSRYLCIIFFAVWMLPCSAAIGASVDPESGKDFILGVGTHISGGRRPLLQSLTLLKQAGVGAIRDDVYWIWVEKQPGVLRVPAECDAYVQASLDRGIEPLVVLGYGNPFHGGGKPHDVQQIQAYVTYARSVVEHFRGKVHLYELWNEWDWKAGGTAPGSAEDYLALISAAYPVLKQSDPTARFLIGAVTPHGIRDGFLKSLVKSGGLHYSDGLSLHTYIHHDQDARPEVWARWMDQVEDELKAWSGRDEVPFYVTEMGWPSYVGKGGVTEDIQAQYLARLFILARTLPFIKGVWWYDFQDDGDDPSNMEFHFGVVGLRYEPKPAYATLVETGALMRNATFQGRLPVPGSDLLALRFRKPDGTAFLVVWAPDGQPGWNLNLSASVRDVALKRLDGIAAGSLDWAADAAAPGTYHAAVGIGAMPIVLSGDLQHVRVTGVRRSGTE